MNDHELAARLATEAGRLLLGVRDEFADHGRPYGGREGGEADVQRPQPPRPEYGSVDPMRGTDTDGMPVDNPSG